MYLTKFPDMTKESFISFDNFWTKARNKQPKDERSVDEIKAEFNEIKKIHQGRGVK